jgi:SAM-dependent methyltransferase
MSIQNAPEIAVADRYSAAANDRQESLCCPIEYRPELLDVIPPEILERDYGCGDPSPFVKPGDTVLDLGAGGGKLCYIAAQLVGAEGRVIGVDCNEEMLALARKFRAEVARRIGFDIVEFRCGMIQDLQLDLELLAQRLGQVDSTGVAALLEQRRIAHALCAEKPMIGDDSVDCVVSNCVLNLVRPEDRRHLFAEVYRVLKDGGRAAISDIVSDEDVPEHLKQDGTLWSGCVSGAWREDKFLQAFADAGFHGVEITQRQEEPWQIVEGIEFRSITVVAYKGKEGPCLERNQAVIYRGPFKQVVDDDGHVYHRGERMAICDKTFKLLMNEPYRRQFFAIEPAEPIELENAQDFHCTGARRRSPKESKGANYNETKLISDDCRGTSPCCE